MTASFVGCRCTHWGVSNIKRISKKFMIFTGKSSAKSTPKYPPFTAYKKLQRPIDHCEPASTDQRKCCHYSNQYFTCCFQVIPCSH